MECKIDAALVSQVINVIAGARNINLNYVELNALFKQLQQLPKIKEEKTAAEIAKDKEVIAKSLATVNATAK